jgi:hypothetical protein
MKYWPNGLGATGSLIGDKEPFATSGDVWFVDSATGTDAASPRGLNEKMPLATLVQAVANAADGDTIVLAATHDETLLANLDIDKKLSVLGSGNSSGIPSAILRTSVSSAYGALSFSSGSAGSLLSNVRIIAAAAQSGVQVYIGAEHNIVLDSLRFEVDQGHDYSLKIAGVIGCLVQRCTFVSIMETDPESAPRAVFLEGCEDILFVEPVFDAGAYGWYQGIAMYTNGPQHNVRMIDATLLRGSDVSMYAASTGAYNVSSSSGQGRVIW